MRLLQSLGLIYITGAFKWDTASRPEQIFKTETTQSKCTSPSMGCLSWSGPNVREINLKRKNPTKPKNIAMTSLAFELDPSKIKKSEFFLFPPHVFYRMIEKIYLFILVALEQQFPFLFSLRILYTQVTAFNPSIIPLTSAILRICLVIGTCLITKQKRDLK